MLNMTVGVLVLYCGHCQAILISELELLDVPTVQQTVVCESQWHCTSIDIFTWIFCAQNTELVPSEDQRLRNIQNA